MQIRPNGPAAEIPEDKLVTISGYGGKVTQMHISEFLKKELMWFRLANRHLEKPSPIDTMNLFTLFIESGEPIPADLRQWFIERVDLFMTHKGEKTLGNVFGFTGRENESGAFVKADRNLVPSMVRTLHHLVLVSGLRPASAARLVVWRENADNSPLPVSLHTKYTRDKNQGKYSDKDYLHPKIDYLVEDREFLETFLLREERPDPETRKDLEKVENILERMKHITPGEYREIISRP